MLGVWEPPIAVLRLLCFHRRGAERIFSYSGILYLQPEFLNDLDCYLFPSVHRKKVSILNSFLSSLIWFRSDLVYFSLKNPLLVLLMTHDELYCVCFFLASDFCEFIARISHWMEKGDFFLREFCSGKLIWLFPRPSDLIYAVEDISIASNLEILVWLDYYSTLVRFSLCACWGQVFLLIHKQIQLFYWFVCLVERQVKQQRIYRN